MTRENIITIPYTIEKENYIIVSDIYIGDFLLCKKNIVIPFIKKIRLTKKDLKKIFLLHLEIDESTIQLFGNDLYSIDSTKDKIDLIFEIKFKNKLYDNKKNLLPYCNFYIDYNDNTHAKCIRKWFLIHDQILEYNKLDDYLFSYFILFKGQDLILKHLFNNEFNVDYLNVGIKIEIIKFYFIKRIFEVIYYTFVTDEVVLIRNEINNYYKSNFINNNIEDIKDITLRNLFINYKINVYNNITSYLSKTNDSISYMTKKDRKIIINWFEESSTKVFNTFLEELKFYYRNIESIYLENINNFIKDVNIFIKKIFDTINSNDLNDFAKQQYFIEYKKQTNNVNYIPFSDKEFFKKFDILFDKYINTIMTIINSK